jgi:RNA polymerase sigma factor (sigma-70 family)
MTRLTALNGGRGTAERFEAVIEPHFAALYRTAYRLSGSVHDAEDLVQEVCVRALPRIAELEQIDHVGHWLYCVMYRVFIDSRRRYEYKHVRALESGEVETLHSDTPSPEEETERAGARQRLSRVWTKIAEEQRVLLVLHDVEGYSLSQMMAITGLKEGTLKSKLHRARIKLGRLLRKEMSAETAIGAIDHEVRRRG